MKRKKGKDSDPGRNYVYKVKAIVEGGDVVADQMHRAHAYGNKLIEIERQRRERFNASVASYDPEIPRLQADHVAASRELHEIEEAIDLRSQADRKKARATPEEVARKKALVAAKKAIFDDLKARKLAVYARREADNRATYGTRVNQDGKEIVIDPIEDEANAARIEVRSRSGLYWGNYELKEMALGGIRSGAPPRFQRWDFGKGSVAVHIKKSQVIEWREAWRRDHGQVRVEMAPAEYRPTHSKSGKFLPPPDPNSVRSKGRGGDNPRSPRKLALVWMRVGSTDTPRRDSPVWCKLLVHLHREPPPDAKIKWVTLHRRLVGRNVRWELRFTLTREDWPAQHGEDGAIGVGIGWGVTPERDLQVACAVTSDGPDRPLAIEDPAWSRCIRVDDAGTVRLVIPREKVEKLRHSDDMREIRDRSYNAIRERFSSWLKGKVELLPPDDDGETTPDLPPPPGGKRGLPDWLCGVVEGKDGEVVYDRRKDVRHLMRWRSPDRLHVLLARWRDHRFPGDRGIYSALEAWRLQDRHVHEYQDSERRKTIRWRDELYRRFAAVACRNYRVVAVKDTDYARLKEKARPGEVDRGYARTYAQIAAPGTLRQHLAEAAAELVKVPAAHLAATCHACGGRDKFDPATERRHACSRCGATWDVDVNVARNLLASAEPARV